MVMSNKEERGNGKELHVSDMFSISIYGYDVWGYGKQIMFIVISTYSADTVQL